MLWVQFDIHVRSEQHCHLLLLCVACVNIESNVKANECNATPSARWIGNCVDVQRTTGCFLFVFIFGFDAIVICEPVTCTNYKYEAEPSALITYNTQIFRFRIRCNCRQQPYRCEMKNQRTIEPNWLIFNSISEYSIDSVIHNSSIWAQCEAWNCYYVSCILPLAVFFENRLIATKTIKGSCTNSILCISICCVYIQSTTAILYCSRPRNCPSIAIRLHMVSHAGSMYVVYYVSGVPLASSTPVSSECGMNDICFCRILMCVCVSVCRVLLLVLVLHWSVYIAFGLND